MKDDEFISVDALLEEFEGAPFENLSFEEWNAKVENPKFRIYYPSQFSREAPELKFDEPKDGSAPKKDGSGMAKFTFSKMHEQHGKGRESSCVVTTPAMHAASGFRESDTGNGFVKSIKGILDLNNPHHRQFWYGCMNPIIAKCALMMLENPGKWGLSCPKYGPDANRNTKKFTEHFNDAMKSFFDLIRFPKISETEIDILSPNRIFYMNPLEYYDEKKEKWNRMKTFLPGSTEPVSMDAIENICKGWMIKNGKAVKGKPKGFEYSADLLITRVVRTSGNSIQIKILNLYIHRFYTTVYKGGRETKHLATLEGRLQNDFSRFVGLEGFKDESEPRQTRAAKSGFNPMIGNESNSQTEQPAEEVPTNVPDVSLTQPMQKTSEASEQRQAESTSSGGKTLPARKFTGFKKPGAAASASDA